MIYIILLFSPLATMLVWAFTHRYRHLTSLPLSSRLMTASISGEQFRKTGSARKNGYGER